ncbi:MAG: energy transducer TonB [Candidatus Omnitrophota bacterium]|nr:energy transducer TonB [Candidatus Omnitrophota bacterium]
MTRNLLKSGLLSIGAHAFLMIPFAFGMARSVGPETDVLAGLSSVELELIAPESFSAKGEEEIQAKSRPAPPREEWLNDSGALSDARPLSPFRNTAPPYPRLARVQGWQGTVLVRAWVAPSGEVASVRVAESSGRGILDRAAAVAVQGWKFRPARRKGQAVASTVDVPITFQLEQKTEQQGRNQ